VSAQGTRTVARFGGIFFEDFDCSTVIGVLTLIPAKDPVITSGRANGCFVSSVRSPPVSPRRPRLPLKRSCSSFCTTDQSAWWWWGSVGVPGAGRRINSNCSTLSLITATGLTPPSTALFPFLHHRTSGVMRRRRHGGFRFWRATSSL
jgi:hypothetical protein